MLKINGKLACSLCILLTIVCQSILPAQTVQKIDFVRDVRPILSDNCFACHGPDEAQRTSDFRLDSKESALAAELGIIVPGEPDNSELVRRILSDDPDEVMPPSNHRKSLSKTQKQLLIDWIRQGASWSEHWSFVPPKRSEPPVVNSDEKLEPIDRFVRSKLQHAGIDYSPTAAPTTLLRRLSFDLTGLPPTIEELESFQKQIGQSGLDQAYQSAVDRLLASPHFGERMAVYWLDLVRYADTVGYHGDQNVSVSPYRDYVIESFNQNMPFDQFTREQLAGDLLKNPTRSQKIASGYNRLGMMSAEGGVQPEEYLNKYASDRVRTTSSVWLGVTLGCAECHDHKFDPFTTREFYQFASFFSDIKEQGLYAGANRTGKWGPQIDIPAPDLAKKLEPLDNEIAQLEQQLQETEQSKKNRREWESNIKSFHYKWKPINVQGFQAPKGVKHEVLDDRSILISGANPDKATYVIVAELDPASRSIRLESIPHPSLPQKGAGRAGNGNFVVSELLLLNEDQSSNSQQLNQEFKSWPDQLKSKVLNFNGASATIEQAGSGHPDKTWSANSAIDRDQHGSQWGWAVLPETKRTNELVLQLSDANKASKLVTIVIQMNHGKGRHTLGHFRLSTSQNRQAVANPLATLPKTDSFHLAKRETKS